jgi:hypothetical protein
VELIKNLVLVAGGDDQVWDSVDHSRRIIDRRADNGLSTLLVQHPLAGHRTLLPDEPVVSGGRAMARGGSTEADRELGERARPHVLELIRSSGAARP